MMKPLAYFIQKRGSICENCNRPSPYFERHHWLVHKMKSKPELDDERNIGLVCKRCHESGIVNSYESRCRFYLRQLSRYPDMEVWLQGLNLKAKERFV